MSATAETSAIALPISLAERGNFANVSDSNHRCQASSRAPGTVATMSSGPLIAQRKVDPERRTPVWSTCALIPSQLNASNCSSPEPKCPTTLRSRAVPSCSVRYMVSPSPTIRAGRRAGMSPRQPPRVGDGGGDDVIARGGRVELAAKRGDLGVVDVVPLDARAGLQPEEATVQAAARVQHDGVWMSGQELVGPRVEMRTPGGHRGRPSRGDGCLLPVVVDALDDLFGEPVTEYRLLEVGVQRLRVQRRQHGLRRSAQVAA